jgi:hypothetical protein
MNLYTLKELGILIERKQNRVIDISLITGVCETSDFGVSILVFQSIANHSNILVQGTPEEVRNKIRDFKTKAPKQTPQTHFKHNKPQFISI